MLPFFRVLSYSFFAETNSWVSDRFINDFMEIASSLDSEKRLTTSALLCTSSHLPDPYGPWGWNGKLVSLRQNKHAAIPSFIELDARTSTINNVLSQVSRSMLVDIVDHRTNDLLVSGYCVADTTRDNDIEVVTMDDMSKKLLEKR